MLSPGQESTPTIAVIIFVTLAVLLVVRAIRKDRKEYGRFKRYRSTTRRQKLYRKWLVESFLVFGLSSSAVLAAVWQHQPLFFDEVRSLPVSVALAAFAERGGDLLTGIIVGITVALLVGSVAAIFLARGAGSVPTIGDISALLPRNRAELRFGALLSVNAGVVEELLFRLALPLLLFAATGNAVVSVAVSVLIFGLLHLYQGVWGVVGSLVIGSVLMALYLLSGNILVPIIVHVLIDLRSLVLIPVVVYRVHRVRGSGLGRPARTA